MSNIKKFNEIEKELIHYNNPEKVGTSYTCSMGYDSTCKPIYIQTPKFKFKMDYDNPSFIDLIIPHENIEFYDFLMTMDEFNIKNTYMNSKEWFNKELPFEAIDDMYKRTIKPNKKNVDPNIRIKIPSENGEMKCSIYNQDRIFMNVNDLKNLNNDDLEIVLIIHLRGLKIYKTSFVFDIYVSQMKVFLNKHIKHNIISEYSIIDDNINDNIDNDIFTEEILNVSGEEKEKEEEEEEEKEKEKQEKEKQEKEKQEKQEKEKQEKEKQEQEKKEKEKQEKINKIQEEILKKKNEMDELLKMI